MGSTAGSYVLHFDPTCGGQSSSPYLPQWSGGAAEENSAQAVTVGTGGAAEGANAELTASGSISGTVTGDGEAAVEGVCVSASPASGEGGGSSTFTGSDGTYTLEGLAADHYYVRFDPTCGQGGESHYAPEWSGGASERAHATSVTVTAGAVTGTVNARLQDAATISGTVTGSPEGKPIEGVCVRASATGEGESSGSAATAADGTYRVAGLAAGSYDVQFVPGCDSASTGQYAGQFYQAATRTTAHPVTVSSGQTAPGIDASLQPLGAIAGTVTDATSAAPVAEACVTATPTEAGSSGAGSATTAADGSYTVAGLAPGQYRVEFDPTCSGTASSEDALGWYRGADIEASAAPVTVAPASTTGSVDGSLARSGTISGTVTAEVGGSPVPEVCVIARPRGETGDLEFVGTQTDGSYSIPGLPADAYTVEADPTCAGSLSSSYLPEWFGGTEEAAAQPVNLAAGGSATADIALSAGGAPPLSVKTASLPSGVADSSYAHTLLAEGGSPPYSWSIEHGSLPAGLHLNARSGAIVGTPTAVGTSSFTVKVTDAGAPPQSAAAGLSISVSAAAAQAAEYGQCVAQKKGEYTEGDCLTKPIKHRKGSYEWKPGPAPTCVAQKKGEYTDAGCVTHSKKPHKGKYEAAPGPGISATMGSVVLEAPELAGAKVTCTGGSASGEVTGAKGGLERIAFTGCEDAGHPCESQGPTGTASHQAGTIDTNELQRRLVGPVSGEVQVQILSAEHEPFLIGFACGAEGYAVIGSLAGRHTGDINAPSLTASTTFASGEGEQALYTEAPGGLGGPVAGAFTAVLTETSASALEIRD